MFRLHPPPNGSVSHYHPQLSSPSLSLLMLRPLLYWVQWRQWLYRLWPVEFWHRSVLQADTHIPKEHGSSVLRVQERRRQNLNANPQLRYFHSYLISVLPLYVHSLIVFMVSSYVCVCVCVCWANDTSWRNVIWSHSIIPHMCLHSVLPETFPYGLQPRGCCQSLTFQNVWRNASRDTCLTLGSEKAWTRVLSV
jgi:hypothetical protein